MLTVRLLPRRGNAVRAATAAVESTAVLVVGHSWAGGMLPSFAWIALMAGAVFVAGLPVLSGRVRLRWAVPGLVVLQLLMHAWLTVLAPMPDMASGAQMAGAHGAGLAGLLAPEMLLVHTAGALLTALLWELRAQVADVVVTWTRPHLPPLPLPRAVPLRTVPPRRPQSLVVALATPRRGPPWSLGAVPARP